MAKDKEKPQTAAAKVKDAEEKAPVYRTDLGEGLPPQEPPATGTDKHA